MPRLPLIDWLVTLVEAALVVALNVRLGEVLGGGIVFLVVVAVCFYFSYVYKVFPQALSRLALAAICFAGLNIMAYYEQVAIDRSWIFLGYLVVSGVSLTAMYQLNIDLVRVPKMGPPEPDALKRELIRNIAAMFALIPGLTLVMFVAPTAMAVWVGRKSTLVETNWITFTNLAILCQAAGALVHQVYLGKLADAQIAHVLRMSRPIPILGVKRKVTQGLLLFFLLGSLAEIARGLWVFWLGSVVFWVLTLRSSWKIWRHVFGGETREVSPGEMTSGYWIVGDVKVFAYSIAVVVAYIMGLVALLAVTTRARIPY